MTSESRPGKLRWPWILVVVAAGVVIAILWLRREPEPIRIGFVGGLSGRVADLGIAGRDGVILAVEERNRDGGIGGRPIELLVRDDRQDPGVAERADRELIEQGVVAIVGHMTSAMSVRAVPFVNAEKVVMVSPTTSAAVLEGLDDHFFRVYPSCAEPARRLAGHMREEDGFRRVSVVYDLANREYSESWYRHFREEFERLGGEVVRVETFTSHPDVPFLDLARQLLEVPVDSVLVIAGGMDTGMICQQLTKLDPDLPVAGTEWGATEDVLRFGGRAMEGFFLVHTFDRRSRAERFVRFCEAFRERFGYEAGFASSHAYDAAQLLFTALERNDDPAALRETLRGLRSFEGLQGPVEMTPEGDARREMFVVRIRDGAFRVEE